MENFLSRLNRNPYQPIDSASITRVDELGNGYDDFGQMIAPKFQAPQQTWGETALGVATAPARMTMGLVESLSPYGADGWQIPPIVQEGANALTAVGDAYNYGMSEDEINSRALGMAGFMMGGGGPALALERSLAQRGINSTADMIPTAVKDYGQAAYRSLRYPNETAVMGDLPPGLFDRTGPQVMPSYGFGSSAGKMAPSSAEYFSDSIRGNVRNNFYNVNDIETLPPSQTGYMNALLQSRKPEFDVIDGGLLDRLSSAYAPDDQLNMFGGRNAKTANLERLAIAERLAAEGADRQAIWDSTGWFQGSDGKWRFEIDDSGSTYNPTRGATQVGHALNHPDLRAAYPDVPGVKLNFSQKAGGGAYFDDLDRIGLGNEVTPKDHSILLHELQHRIQKGEGFAKGGNQESMAPPMNSRKAWEVRLPAAVRAELDERGIAKMYEWDDGWPAIKEALRARIEDDIGKPFQFRTIPGMDGMDEAAFALEQARIYPAEALNAMSLNGLKGLGYRDYERLAGEVEARNVQKRMNMSADERRATPPWETQDIPFEDQIVRLYSNASKEGALPAILAGQETAPLRGYHGSMYQDYLPAAKARGEFWAASDPAYDGIPVNSRNPQRLYDFFESSTGQTAYPSVTPVEMNFKNPLVAGGEAPTPWTQVPFEGGKASTEDIVRLARERGNDGVIFRNLQESGPVSDEYVALAPGTVRSPLTGEVLFSNSDSRPALLAGAIGGEQRGITAYHGSPHDFDKFDLSKIGTGEGAQAYGHGLYFAENEGTAKWYRDQIADGWSPVFGGKPWDAANPQHQAAAYFGNANMDRAVALGQARKQLAERRRFNKDDAPMWGEVVKILEGDGPLLEKSKGHMYEVRINADPNDFLDWDKPLSQQSEKVRSVWENYARSPDAAKRAEDFYSYKPGMTLADLPEFKDPYGSTILRSTPGATESAATAYLREQGIPGIKYLDQMSRNAGDGSRNYVVFDDSLIEILKKYGLLAPGAMYGGNALFSQAQDQQY